MGQSVFFDLDGTLCQSCAPFASIFLSSCASLLVADARLEPQTLLRTWASALEEPGPSTTAGCLARALDRCGCAAPPILLDQCAHALNHNWACAQALSAGAEAVLSALHARSVPVGIITNGPSDAQRAVVAALHLEALCHWVIVSGDANVGVRKPEAGIFLHALSMAQAAAHEAWYVGDSAINDIAGATRVGMRMCWLCAQDHPLPANVAEPDAHISALPELLEVLGL